MIREQLVRFAITFAVTIAAALSGYYTAYTSLRVELAGKAGEQYVTKIDLRLSRLEATINERFASKDDFFEFKREVIAKLTAIETVLSTKGGRGHDASIPN